MISPWVCFFYKASRYLNNTQQGEDKIFILTMKTWDQVQEKLSHFYTTSLQMLSWKPCQTCWAH